MRQAIPIETERLLLRELTLEDAEFIIALLNDPDWLYFIGDRGVRTVEQAGGYIRGLIAMYERYGYGLWLMVRKVDAAALGMCGLIRREALADVDIGFALLPAFRAKGYTSEAAAATLKYAREALGLKRVVAITTLDNRASVSVLERAGMRFETTIHLPGDPEQLNLFAIDWVED